MIAKRVPRRKDTSSVARLARYVVNAQGGIDPRSWSRTADYILDSDAETNDQGEKVGGVRVTNCGTDDPAAATLLIQATQAINTRSKNDKTYHLVFSFPPGEQPPLDVLHAIEDDLCASIGYADHQRISAVHIDTDHLHVHVAINKVHPTGYQNIEPYFDKRRLMEACERLEIKYGLERTNHGIGENENERPDRDKIQLGPEQQPSNRDSRFRRYLRESYNLAITERPEAQTLNGLRTLSGCHMARTPERSSMLLSGYARAGLQQRGKEHTVSVRRPGHGNRTNDGPSRRVIGAVVASIEVQSGIETLATYVARDVAPAMREAKTWQAVHDALAGHGLEMKRRDAGLVIGDAGIPLWVRASQCSREFGMKAMTDRLGPFKASSRRQQGKPGAQRAYTPRPVHKHSSTAPLFAQYQRERQERLVARKAGFAEIRRENAAYQVQLKNWQITQRALLKVGTKGVTRKLMTATLRDTSAAARQKQRAAMQARREQIHKETTMPSWADWLARQAETGNADALAVLRSRAEREQRLQGDLLTAQRAERAKAVVFNALKPTCRRDGTMSYRTIDGGMVIDRRSHVQAQKATTGAALVALTLAAEKFAGQPLIVKGADEFKRDVARLAAMHKVNVTFADPAMEAVRQSAEVGRRQAVAGQQPVPDRYSRLTDYGAAPYQHEKGARDSYFVTLEGTDGRQRTLWGVDLERALSESGATIGDRIGIEHAGAEPVTLPSGAESQRNSWRIEVAPKGKAADKETTPEPAIARGEAVDSWIEKRNAARDKLSSIDYHRRWTPADAGNVTYQGRRRMEDGSEVLLLKRGDEMLVKPSSTRTVAKASKWKIGQSVQLDARDRFIDNSRATEL